MKEQCYFYCDISGISMGSHYNSATEAVELTVLSTVFGGNTEKDLISSYSSLPNTNIIPDASLNSITINTEAKKKAIMEALFTVQPENYFITNKDIFGYTKSVLGILLRHKAPVDVTICFSSTIVFGISIEDEPVAMIKFFADTLISCFEFFTETVFVSTKVAVPGI